MIALGPQDVGEQKERPAENLDAGREFAAVRRKPEPRPRRPGERAAKALVYVKGPTPLHLPLTSYSHFDGMTWREEPCCDRQFPAEPEPTGTWLRLPRLDAPFLAGTVVHQVKIGTLDSSPMPVPPHLLRFRVGSVNRLDFFGWAQIRHRAHDRTGRFPRGQSSTPRRARSTRERLRSFPFWPRLERHDDHHLSFGDAYAISPAVVTLARSIVAGLPEGWCQVEAVIETLCGRATPTIDRRRPPRAAPTSSPISCSAHVKVQTTCLRPRRPFSCGHWAIPRGSSAACMWRRGGTTRAPGTRR